MSCPSARSLCDKTLTESLAESNHRASFLEERECSLQLRLNEADATTATGQDLIGSLRKELLEYQINLSRQEGSQSAAEQIAEKCVREAKQRIQELDSKTSSLRGELGEKQQIISELTQRLAIVETPSNQHEQELLILKARVHELERSEKQLLERATSITARHEHGDLVRESNNCLMVIHISGCRTTTNGCWSRVSPKRPETSLSASLWQRTMISEGFVFILPYPLLI
jgi:predicted RNase H-like nuclease (RuvC/YqgF family)